MGPGPRPPGRTPTGDRPDDATIAAGTGGAVYTTPLPMASPVALATRLPTRPRRVRSADHKPAYTGGPNTGHRMLTVQ